MTNVLRSFAGQVTRRLFLNQPAWVALRRWRWLILVIGLVLAIAIDASDFPLPDFLVYGVGLTSLCWGLMTLLANTLFQHAKSEEEFARHQQFSRQLTECQDWPKLTRLVTEFPSQWLPVTQVALLMYDHRQARLELAAEWQASGVQRLDQAPPFNLCRQCQTAHVFELDHLTRCELDAPAKAQAVEYCLPLKYDRLLIGVLHFKCNRAQSFTSEQLQFLDRAAPEITMALVLSIAHPRQLNLARVEAQLAERRHIVRVLHDDLAQEVFFLQLGLDQIGSDPATLFNAANRQIMDRLQAVAAQVYERIRSNLAILRSWEHTGFTEAVYNLAKTVSTNLGLPIEIETEGEIEALTAPLAQQVFEIIREGLTNIEKHARARQVQLVLGWTNDYLTVRLSDDGRGFNPAVAQDGHYGLTLMREQIEAQTGEFQIDSAPGQGTRLYCKIPYRVRSDVSSLDVASSQI